ncbi:hypothetical protein SK128_006199, partial [Halocaridina rubra]
MKEDTSQRTSSSGHCERLRTSHSTSVTSGPCQFCTFRHGPGNCPATDGTCHNCGHRGHWVNPAKCPAKLYPVALCSKTEHYDKCCQTRMKDNGQGGSSSKGKASTSSRQSPTKNIATVIVLDQLLPPITRLPCLYVFIWYLAKLRHGFICFLTR